MAIQFSNLASTTLASGVSSTATSISVTSAASFPSLGSGDYFYATLGAGTGSEIVKVTAISGTTLTVVRGQDGTTAVSHSANADVALRVTAGALEDLRDGGQIYTAGSGITLSGNAFSLTDKANYDAAYGWGDHAQAGYLTSYTDTNTTYTAGSGITLTGTTFSLTDKTNYDAAYGWGDHSAAGYLTSHQSLSGYATETYVGTQIANLVDSAPATMDTLNELAAALGDDANFSTTVTNSIATKLPKSGGTMTGNLTIDYTGHQTGDAGLVITNDSSDWGIKVDKDGTADYGILSQTDGANAIVVRNAAGTNKIQLQGDGDATFEGNVSISGYLSGSTIYNTGDYRILNNAGTAWHDVVTRGSGDNYTVNALGGFKIGSTTVIDSSRNLTVATGASSGKFAVMASSPHGSYDFYNNGTTYLNGSTTVDDALNLTGGNAKLQISGTTVIDASRNLTNINAITSTGVAALTRGNGSVGAPNTANHDTGTRIELYNTSATSWYAIGIESNTMWFNSDSHYRFYTDAVSKVDFDSSGVVNAVGGYKVNGTTVIDSSREIKFTKGSSGALASRTGFSDFIGYNPSYGSYIGGGANNANSWIYSGGYISQGGVHTLWHSGNDGSGSGLDADLLDGYNTSTSATANTVAVRDSNGHIYGNYILGSYFNASFGNSENPTIGQIWTQSTGDNYLRKSTPAHLRSQLGLWWSGNDGSGSGLDADLLDGNNSGAFLKSGAGDSVSGWWISAARNGNSSAGTTPHIYFSHSDGYGMHINTYNTSSGIYALELHNDSNELFGVRNNGDIRVNNNVLIDQPGNTYSTTRRRRDHHTGHLEGSYNNVGGNGAKSNPIYTIGSSYNPVDASLADMYGIGFTSVGASFISGGLSFGDWGMYVAADGDARIFMDGSGGKIAALGEIRGAKFGDINDTAYYLDPNSTSIVNSLRGKALAANMAGSQSSGDGLALYGNYSGGEPTYGMMFAGRGTFGGHGPMAASDWATYFMMNNDSSRGWIFRRQSSGNSASITAGGLATFDDSVRSPIFYDSNNTTYYLDPADTSKMAHLRLISNDSYLKLGTDGATTTTRDANRPQIEIGAGHAYPHFTLYSSGTNTTHGGVISFRSALPSGFRRWGIGTANYNPDSIQIGYFDNNDNPHYGVGVGGWTYDSYARFVIRTGYSEARGSMRSPIFYDLDNTGYYLDPASSGVSANFAGRIQVGTFAPSTSNPGEAWIGRATDRDQGTLSVQLGTGSGRKFEVVDAGWTTVEFSADDSGNAIANSSMRAPVFYDNNNTAYYLDPASGSRLGGLHKPDRLSLQHNGNQGTPRWDFRAYVVESPHFYGHSGSGDIYWGESGNGNQMRGSLYVPKVYDYNDSGYYIDPNGLSNIRTIHLSGAANTTYATPNLMSYSTSNSAGVVNYHLRFNRNNGVANGHISTNYYATTYSTTSDYRVKEDFQPMVNATSRLMALNPINFQWKDSDIRTDGFLAHEVAEVVSDAVVGEKDAVDEKGNDELQSLDQSKLVPLLVKTIQELEARIAALENA